MACPLTTICAACYSNSVGFREDILKKLAKAQEPPPAKLQKALPAPDMNTKKKRGGKRVRKMKDRYTMSETRKAANRVGFGEVRRVHFFAAWM